MNEPLPTEYFSRATPPRGLGLNRRLRWISVVLWASFLGAAVGIAAIMLMPEGWALPPIDLEDAALAFGLLWMLALIPATVVGVLLGQEPT